jgi:hypothetical protein
MTSTRKNAEATKHENSTKKITEKDVVNLISLQKLPIKDLDYAKKHITIKSKGQTATFEVKITDIDGEEYACIFELKTYT